MTNKKITTILKKYQKTSRSNKARKGYFGLFEKRMLFRTTKTENPSTTLNLVNKVLRKIVAKTT